MTVSFSLRGQPVRLAEDRYGVSWQVIPTRQFELLADPDPRRAQAAMHATLAMNKLDIAAMEQAADSGGVE